MVLSSFYLACTQPSLPTTSPARTKADVSLTFGYLGSSLCASNYESEKELTVTIHCLQTDSQGNSSAQMLNPYSYKVTNNDNEVSNIEFKGIPFPSSSYFIYTVEVTKGSLTSCFQCCQPYSACSPVWRKDSPVYSESTVPTKINLRPQFKGCLK